MKISSTPVSASSSDIPSGQSIPEASARDRGVTPRVVVLSLFLACFFGWLIAVIDYRHANTFLGATHLPPGAVGALLVLVLVVNPLMCLLRLRRFSRNEILTIYLISLFATTVAGIGGNNYWTIFIIGPFYYATRENGWRETFGDLSWWMTPAIRRDGSYNAPVVEGWFNGIKSGESIPWDAWIVPLGAWSALMIATYVMMGCLSVMLRAQWGEREALSFPLLRLPLELTEEIDHNDKYAIWSHFLRNPLMWTGFGVAAFISALNGVNLYFPDMPTFPLSIEEWRLFTEAPWNQIGWVPIRVWPIAVGVCYLLTREVSFSLWFFFWALKAQLVAAYLMGYVPSTLTRGIGAWAGQQIFLSFQELGAYLAIVGIVLWTGREHFLFVVQRAFGRAKASQTEARDALPYPVAFWGFIISFGFIIGWTLLAGINIRLAMALWGSYLLVAIVLSRVVAEVGLLFVHSSWLPLGALANLFGAGAGTYLSPQHGLVPASLVESSLVEDFRGSMMPSFVQSFKLAADRGINSRGLWWLIFAVIIIGLAMTVHMNVRLGYETGGLSMHGWLASGGPRVAPNNVSTMAKGVSESSPAFAVWIGVGMATILALTWCRSRFLWFPLHPLGYAVAISLPMHVFWLSAFIAWGCKTLVTRFAGNDAARRLNAFFLGLVFGDVAMMLIWLAIDAWQGRTGHQLMP
jgi:hypothetical protein